MAKELDFSGIYKYNPTYIHSSLSGFEGGIKKIGVPERTLENILDEVKQEIFKEVNSQYQYFVSLEEALVKELKKKNPKLAPQNRKEFIERYKKLNQIFKSEDAFVYDLVDIKAKINTGKLNEQVKNAVQDVIKEILEVNKVVLPSIRTSGTKDQLERSRKAEKHFKDEVERKAKKQEKNVLEEIKKQLSKREAEVKEIVQNIKNPLNNLINYAAKQISVHYADEENSKEKKAVITSYQKFMEMILSMMRKSNMVDWKKDYEMVLKDIPKNIEELSSILDREDPEWIIRHLTIMKKFSFYDDLIDNFQFSQITGNMFEAMLRDTIHQVIANEIGNELWEEVGSLFLDAGYVGLGINANINYEKVTTIDLETHKIEQNKTPIFFGSSLKLKEGEQNISLDSSPIERYLKNLEANLSGDSYSQMEYIRKNLIALNIFANDREENSSFLETVNNYFENYDSFEQEVIFLAMIVRFLIGFVRKNSEETSKYLGVDMEKGTEYGKVLDELYLNTFIITQDHIYSTVDILGFILESIGEKKEKWHQTGIQMKLTGKKNFSSAEEQLIRLSNLKQKLDFGNSNNYDILIKNGEIKALLEDLAQTFGVSSYTAATMSVNSKTLNEMGVKLNYK